MSPKLMIFAAKMLRMASDKYSNHICNDMDKRILDALGFTDEEKTALALEYSQWNENKAEPEDPIKFQWIHDTCWMDFLAHKLEETAKATHEPPKV